MITVILKATTDVATKSGHEEVEYPEATQAASVPIGGKTLLRVMKDREIIAEWDWDLVRTWKTG